LIIQKLKNIFFAQLFGTTNKIISQTMEPDTKYVIATTCTNFFTLTWISTSIFIANVLSKKIKALFSQWTQDMVYKIVTNGIREVDEPIMEPVYGTITKYRKKRVLATRPATRKEAILSTRTAYRKKPVYETRTAYKQEPIFKTREKIRLEPVYKKIRKTKPKYRTVHNSRQIAKTRTKTEYYTAIETYIEYETKRTEHIDYTYHPNGNNYFTTHQVQATRTRPVQKMRQVPETYYETEYFTESVYDGEEEWYETVQDGSREVIYEEEYIDGYEDVPYKESYQSGYENVPYDEPYISGYRDVTYEETYFTEGEDEPYQEKCRIGEKQVGTKKVEKNYTDVELDRVGRLVSRIITELTPLVWVCFAVPFAFISQSVSFALQLYFSVVGTWKNNKEVTISIMAIGATNFVFIVVLLVLFMVTSRALIQKRKERNILKIVWKKTGSNEDLYDCILSGHGILLNELEQIIDLTKKQESGLLDRLKTKPGSCWTMSKRFLCCCTKFKNKTPCVYESEYDDLYF
jgi:hypothetical protein